MPAGSPRFDVANELNVLWDQLNCWRVGTYRDAAMPEKITLQRARAKDDSE